MNLFFNDIASYYDDMIGFDAALERRTAVLGKFVTPGMKYAADIGCGTGLDSISLFRLGLNVRAFDPSEGMLEYARNNAEKHGAKIKFYCSAFNTIPAIYDSSFDIAVSLGNTLANIKREDLDSSLRSLYKILKPGGKGLLHILNFEKLRINNERIVNITRKDDVYFIRFYDFLDDRINFNILRFSAGNPKDRIIESTSLYAYTPEELVSHIESAGFNEIEVYGNLEKDLFDKTASGDVVISCTR